MSGKGLRSSLGGGEEQSPAGQAGGGGSRHRWVPCCGHGWPSPQGPAQHQALSTAPPGRVGRRGPCTGRCPAPPSPQPSHGVSQTPLLCTPFTPCRPDPCGTVVGDPEKGRAPTRLSPLPFHVSSVLTWFQSPPVPESRGRGGNLAKQSILGPRCGCRAPLPASTLPALLPGLGPLLWEPQKQNLRNDVLCWCNRFSVFLGSSC